MNNGYTTIEIAGEKIGLKFGLPAVRQISEKLSTSELISNNQYNEVGIAHIIYAGYCNWCIVKDTAKEKQFEFFYDFVEDAAINGNIQPLQEAVKCFEESKFLKQVTEKVDEGAKKKRGHLKK